MSFGESYQRFLETINKRIPIKAITGPLDRKYPLTSFFVFLVIILVVLFLIFGDAFSSGFQSSSISSTDITLS